VRKQRSGCLSIALVMIVFAVLLGGIGVWTVVAIDRAVPRFFEQDTPSEVFAEGLVLAISADLAEDPHLPARPPDGALPLCASVSQVYDHAFATAFGLMRATDNGASLYDMLIERSVCIRIDDLDYNSAYSSSRQRGGQWVSSEIVVDRGQVRTISADVLAAILVHEATHIRRTIDQTACFYEPVANDEDPCETLHNGVMVTEEVAAHAAEAEFWIAMYGGNGKKRAFADDSYENSLAKAYQKGDAVFADFVRRGRSDPREGEGFRD
jgi:hypothetical protein